MTKTQWLGIAGISSCLFAGSAMAELTGNIGVSNNYIWRGVTQTDDESAVSGGIDFKDKSGLYAGTWFSNMANNSYKHDLYAGFAGKSGQIGYDAGLIMHMYPVDNNVDFTELYVNAGVKQFNFGLAFTINSDAGGDDSDIYMFASGKFEVKKGLTVDALVGNYQFDSPFNEDYMHLRVGMSKDDISFAVEKNDQSAADADDMRLTVSWTKEIAL
ncbi:MAG: TorF family putative porin [Gammaproteobacteria bacterium]|nr:TorF family putative porin [Gammaproteobacteria bacterium]MDH5736373.1 TorF family putative porin [Gammaproteobacteria bacterium]